MTVRGTRNLIGAEADELAYAIASMSSVCRGAGYQRFIPSTLAERSLFENQMGDNRMYEFKDRSDRDLVLLPEVTAVARQEYRDHWKDSLPKPVELYYAQRCYRYDRPQYGRYREFYQFGVECMGENSEPPWTLLRACLASVNLGKDDYEWRDGVKRGLGYYVEDGIEVWSEGMQIAGGGRYPEGIGWALGVERVLLARDRVVLAKTAEKEKIG